MALQLRIDAAVFEAENTRRVLQHTVEELLRTRDVFNTLNQNNKILETLGAFWFEQSQIPFLQTCSKAAALQRTDNFF